jgi:hypothetical protein
MYIWHPWRSQDLYQVITCTEINQWTGVSKLYSSDYEFVNIAFVETGPSERSQAPLHPSWNCHYVGPSIDGITLNRFVRTSRKSFLDSFPSCRKKYYNHNTFEYIIISIWYNKIIWDWTRWRSSWRIFGKFVVRISSGKQAVLTESFGDFRNHPRQMLRSTSVRLRALSSLPLPIHY